ncbi:hypothetical protein CC86DRAFT_456886 [Ophiobolus disseminans]|uniref:Zn(2)-C6 fungal-type domain-containing protein n=1 Tax=Ophiobolus disseminans TaxID=1469910 RepID=A0A6A6ZVS9_9PLEO|nr:hypothetical protein CC86DRAFT_456886 [Ophiobolus disseminans]
MVGVPGRSKGCHTCRRRKKKCDLQRPMCGNCTRGKFECAGYNRDMIVVQVNQHGKGTYKQQAPKAINQISDPPLRHMSPTDIRHRELNRTTFELECFGCLRSLLTPPTQRHGNNTSVDKIPAFVDEWWAQIYQQASRSDMIRCSMLCVSAYQVGHTRRDPSLRNRGAELYSEAIRVMSRALSPKQLMKVESVTFELEMAAYALALHEYLRQDIPYIEEQKPPVARFRKYYDRDEMRFSSREKGHLAGIVKYMQSQDPASYAEPARHQIFVQLRQFWLPLCIESRTGTYLATEEWLTKPWQGLCKSYYDTMLDTVARIPGMLQLWDTLKTAVRGPEADERASVLRAVCFDIGSEFEKWHHDLATARPSFTPNEASALRTQINTLALEDLPQILIKHGPWYLYTWMMHWAMRIVLYCTTPLMYLRFPPTRSECIVVAPTSIGTYCLSIARGVKYFLQPGQVGILMEMAMRMPVSFVQKALADPRLKATGDPKLDEAEMILKTVGKVGTELAIRETCGQFCMTGTGS